MLHTNDSESIKIKSAMLFKEKIKIKNMFLPLTYNPIVEQNT